MPSPKLTKAIRADMIESVIAATYIPEKKKVIMESTGLAAREAIRALLPTGFERAIGTLPREWFNRIVSVSPSRTVNPSNILNLKGPALWGGSISIGEPILVPANLYCQMGNAIHDTVQAAFPGHPTWEKILAVQIEEATKLRAEEDAMRGDLAAFLASCRSYKDVMEKFPAFERHLPKTPAKAMPLVVQTAPLQQKLAKLGFDQGAATLQPE